MWWNEPNQNKLANIVNYRSSDSGVPAAKIYSYNSKNKLISIPKNVPNNQISSHKPTEDAQKQKYADTLVACKLHSFLWKFNQTK